MKINVNLTIDLDMKELSEINFDKVMANIKSQLVTNLCDSIENIKEEKTTQVCNLLTSNVYSDHKEFLAKELKVYTLGSFSKSYGSCVSSYGQLLKNPRAESFCRIHRALGFKIQIIDSLNNVLIQTNDSDKLISFINDYSSKFNIAELARNHYMAMSTYYHVLNTLVLKNMLMVLDDFKLKMNIVKA